jgi:hypothetical protein
MCLCDNFTMFRVFLSRIIYSKRHSMCYIIIMFIRKIIYPKRNYVCCMIGLYINTYQYVFIRKLSCMKCGC